MIKLVIGAMQTEYSGRPDSDRHYMFANPSQDNIAERAQRCLASLPYEFRSWQWTLARFRTDNLWSTAKVVLEDLESNWLYSYPGPTLLCTLNKKTRIIVWWMHLLLRQSHNGEKCDSKPLGTSPLDDGLLRK